MANDSLDTSQAEDAFSLVLDPAAYEPLPDDWLIGLTDIVGSTAAVNAGRYEDVIYAGASVIASSRRRMLGRSTVDFLRGVRATGEAFAARARSNRCAVSASSSCSALARASSTLSEAPDRSPRSRRV